MKPKRSAFSVQRSVVAALTAGYLLLATLCSAALTVTNLAPTSVTSTSATLGVALTDTNTVNPLLWIYWGTTSGGTNTNYWTSAIDLGTNAVGNKTTNLVTLASGTRYWFRGYAEEATNSTSNAWVSAATSFYTLATNPAALAGTTNVPLLVDKDTGAVVAPTNFTTWLGTLTADGLTAVSNLTVTADAKAVAAQASGTWASNAVAAASNDVVDAKAQVGAVSNAMIDVTTRFNTVTNGYGILYDGGTISLDTASGILTNLGAANISDLTVSNGILNLTNCTGLGIVSGSAVATQAAIAVGSALTNVAGALGVGGLSTTGLVMAGSNIVMSGTLRMSTNATPSNGKTLSLYAGDANAQQVFDFVALGQTPRTWYGMTCDQSNNVYVCVNNGGIYRQANGTGDFVTLGQTTRAWVGMTCDQSNNVYASVVNGNIYRQANGTGDFVTLGQTVRSWSKMTCDQSNNVYACVWGGDIYRQANGTGDFVTLSQASRNWYGMTCDRSNNVYAGVWNGDIYRQVNGVGDFIALGQTTRNWAGMVCDQSNNVYACVNGGDIYRQANGVGDFVALGQTSRDWLGMTCDQSNNVYACVNDGDIYRLQDMTGTSYVGGDASINSGLGVGAGTSTIKFKLATPSVDNFTPQTLTTAGTMTWNAFDYRGSFSAASLSTTGTANIASIVVSNGADIRGTLTAENYAGNGYGLTNLNLPSGTWASNAVAAASNDVVDAKAQVGAVSDLVVAVTALVADLTNKVANGFSSLTISQLTVPVRITLSNDLQISGGQINGTNGFWMIQGATNYFIRLSASE